MTSDPHEEGAGKAGTQAYSADVSPDPISYPRIPALDILRGIAVLAALAVSIWVFGGFTLNKQIQLLTHPSGGNYRLFATVSLLLEGKMMALICIVFGAGMVLYRAKQMESNLAKAHDFIVRRQMWLIAFGVLNAIIFLWSYDLLFQLGVVGIILIPFVHLSPKKLLVAAVLFSLVFFGKQYWNYADDRKALKKYEAVIAVEKKIKQDSIDLAKKDSINNIGKPIASINTTKDTAAEKVKKDTLTKAQAKDKEAWEGLLKGMKYDPKIDSGKIKAMRNTDGYGAIWDHLLRDSQSREARWTYQIGVWQLAMLMLLGMALFKIGFFTHQFSTGRYLLVAVVCIGIGLLLGWYRIYFHNATLIDYTRYIKGHWLPFDFFIPAERSLMAIGYAGLIMAMLKIGKLSRCWQALADTGRLSLTNYLVQSIFCALFFTGFGMNNYGKLNQLELYWLVAEIWLVQIVFSVFWLRYFHQGPAEWLWHSLVALEWKPFKKQPIISVTEPAAAKA
jgi:uncharacterized protein